MEINHFSDEKHPLILTKLPQGVSGTIICSCCSQHISESAYCCFNCYIFLHESCVELALQITHGMHSQHPLKLLPIPQQRHCYCDMCGEDIIGFTYRCSECEFNLDVSCAQKKVLYHFSHDEHYLFLKDLQPDHDSQVVCRGCKHPITGSMYCCDECKFFLHKSCAELPLQITLPMHSEHPLELLKEFPSGIFRCDICKRECSGFVYHCSNECKYNVDILCSQVMAHSINKYTLIRKVLQPDGSEETACYACKQPITKSTTYYSDEYKLFLHKSCAEAPSEIMHPMHSEHPLMLFDKPPYWSRSFTCNICRRELSEFTYHCFECEFNVDVSCAQKEVLDHFSHDEHFLLLEDLQDEVVEKVCYGCEQPITRSAYCCDECEFFLHKSCAKLPLKITLPMHSEHPLELLRESPLSRNYCCNICGRECSGFTYHCSEGKYDVDVLCAQLQNMVDHPSHHHPLKLQPRTALFFCDACHTEERDELYCCSICSLWIHKTCGSRPIPYPFKGHLHPLSLDYTFPEIYKDYDLRCDICQKELNPNHWVYYCGPCRFFIHLSCMKSKEDEPDEDDSDAEIPEGVICLPGETISSVLIQHFLEKDLSQQIQQTKTIKHFSHVHPLILTSVQDDYSEMDNDDQETFCSGCVEPISDSCYCCAQCNYFIHLYCAQLPQKLSSIHHSDHQLSLNYCEEFFPSFCCHICRWDQNGLFYECKECNFLLDIRCALLPSTIKHEDHKHVLVQKFEEEQCCSACNINRYRSTFFICDTCNYNLELDCAILPQRIKHRWDDHALILSFPPFYYHPDKFMCDLCETEIHPKYWLYHCLECDNSFHPYCIPKHGSFTRHRTFGGKLQIDCHQHTLTFVRKVKCKSSCANCHDNLVGYGAFECEPCYFHLCWRCVLEIVKVAWCGTKDSNTEENNGEEHTKSRFVLQD